VQNEKTNQAAPAQYNEIAIAESNARIWQYSWLLIVVFTGSIWNRLKSREICLILKGRKSKKLR